MDLLTEHLIQTHFFVLPKHIGQFVLSLARQDARVRYTASISFLTFERCISDIQLFSSLFFVVVVAVDVVVDIPPFQTYICMFATCATLFDGTRFLITPTSRTSMQDMVNTDTVTKTLIHNRLIHTRTMERKKK